MARWHPQAVLSEIASALGPISGVFGPIQRRENGDDGDDDEQLDERECSDALVRSWFSLVHNGTCYGSRSRCGSLSLFQRRKAMSLRSKNISPSFAPSTWPSQNRTLISPTWRRCALAVP